MEGLVPLSLFFASLFFLATASTDPLDLAAVQGVYRCLDNPPQLTGWSSTGGDPCGKETWRGITCSGQSVLSINIKGMGVGGVLSSELANLLSLEELDVSYNNIGGEIPYGLPPNATHINLSVNNFDGMPCLWPSVKALRHLNVSHNSLSGSIGNVFTDLQNLRTLDLSFNRFTGDLPTSFGLLSRLDTLCLQNNNLTGSVSILAHLPLYILYLEDNHFSGYIPREFGFIPVLRISGNMFQPGSNPNPDIPQPVANSSNPNFLSCKKNSESPKSPPSSPGFPSVPDHDSEKSMPPQGEVTDHE